MRKFFVLILLLSNLYAGTNQVISNAMHSIVNLYAFGNHKHDHTLGSGIIIDAKNGYIVTNAHVVNGYYNIIATMEDKNYYKARIVGLDPDSDIAVLQIKAKNITALPISHKPITIGENVYAIGNPYGFNHSVTSGIVSATGRKLGLIKFENYIQIDAPINPGNSGGALIDGNGMLIGINTAIFSQTGTNNGLGFAIPAFMFEPLVHQIVKFGGIKRGLLGVYVQELTPNIASALGVRAATGVVVNNIIPKSNAEKIGLKKFDTIISVNKNAINNFTDLQSSVATIRLNDSFELDVIRNSKQTTLKGKLLNFSQQKSNNLLSGIKLSPMSYWDESEKLVTGLEVVSVDEDSKAWMADLRVNDIITSINKKPLTSLADLKQFEQNKYQHLLLQIKRKALDQLLVIR